MAVKKKVKTQVKLQIPAGNANPAPPVGPALGQQGVNIMDFCKQFNARTQSQEAGMTIPVVITVFEDRSFTFITKMPPVSALVKKAAGLAKMNKWEEASALWQKYTESKNKRHKIHALYNLAVAGEMDGNIETAIELNNKASKISSSPVFADENEIIRKYSAVLAKRKIELAKLNSMNYEL